LEGRDMDIEDSTQDKQRVRVTTPAPIHPGWNNDSQIKLVFVSVVFVVAVWVGVLIYLGRELLQRLTG
jgi:hypothetical protein